MGNIKLEIRDLSLKFGIQKVLKHIYLNVPENSVVAVIGPSGSGKSSLLRSINRMHDLNPKAKLSGKILLDGQNILSNELNVVETRRKVGMVFQRPNPFPKTVEKNISYGLEIAGEKDKVKISEAVEKTLKGCGLWDEVKKDLRKPATHLSYGQQQRLCIARAIIVEPDILLMDEPCSALDVFSTSKIEELIQELKKKVTIIIVTHSMQQAQRIADYTAFMYLGNLVEFGPTRHIFSEAQQHLTQKYISGNIG